MSTLFKGNEIKPLNFKFVLCVSAFIQRYLIEQVGVDRENTRVVHNGIDSMCFLPKSNRSTSDTLKLLYAGGIWEHKGIETAIDAMAHVVNDFGVRNVDLTIVGSGHPNYVKYIKNRIHEADIDNVITFKEWIPRGEMPGLYQQYDVLIFPSTGPEALARVVQEAMACGLVVIGSNTGGTPEILQDGENGLLFEAGDSWMLAEKIKQVTNDDNMVRRLTQAGRKTIEERFTIERMADEVEMVLQDILIDKFN